tara:strand:- start:333 stop:737 length:405 start_codon:yes stop_codon:yes gene_type:complete
MTDTLSAFVVVVSLICLTGFILDAQAQSTPDIEQQLIDLANKEIQHARSKNKNSFSALVGPLRGRENKEADELRQRLVEAYQEAANSHLMMSRSLLNIVDEIHRQGLGTQQTILEVTQSQLELCQQSLRNLKTQ